MTAGAVWRFFPAGSEGNRLSLADPGNGGSAAAWELPRQTGRDGLCLADYVLPGGDHVAMFVTTAGRQVRERVERWKEEGEYLKSHAFAALALETAEAAAECLHWRLRREWGIAGDEAESVSDLLAARYRGKRYSFGYPACPDLEGQRQLFAALAARGDRRRAHRRRHDGARGQRVGAGVSPPGRAVLRGLTARFRHPLHPEPRRCHPALVRCLRTSR